MAALFGRLAYVEHWGSGHAVCWTAQSATGSRCAGDIVCHDCQQVLWCRGHDPWRRQSNDSPDHWGRTRAAGDDSALETLQDVLRLADRCPPGPAGDQLRRSACELIEAPSDSHRNICRRRMLAFVSRAEVRASRGRAREGDPPVEALTALTLALTRNQRSR